MSSTLIIKATDNATVTTGGTAVSLAATSVVAQSCIIQALDDNSGAIYVGDADVLASTKRGIKLAAGATLTLTANDGTLDLSTVFIDATANGDAVSLIYQQRV